MITEEIKKSVLKLNVIDRVHLAEALLDSLDKTDEQIEQMWILESEKRYKAYKDGHIKGISLEQLRSSIQK
ncbi:MAG: addiction module protein [Proteobacteria bacterium]|nr:addiction module protein [Pseudomonadota bacterium]MBU1585956.1 addiction module protein [Pseudomonadota bacterium]MBU2452214.1 addiction module protein [Pseudomonadota bacterium]MBU2628228.1 addiction module protein [Pseudomonadota bacterium]